MALLGLNELTVIDHSDRVKQIVVFYSNNKFIIKTITVYHQFTSKKFTSQMQHQCNDPIIRNVTNFIISTHLQNNNTLLKFCPKQHSNSHTFVLHHFIIPVGITFIIPVSAERQALGPLVKDME